MGFEIILTAPREIFKCHGKITVHLRNAGEYLLSFCNNLGPYSISGDYRNIKTLHPYAPISDKTHKTLKSIRNRLDQQCFLLARETAPMKRSPKTDQKVNLLKACEGRIFTQYLRERAHARNAWIALQLNLHGQLPCENMAAHFIGDSIQPLIARICGGI